MCQEKKPPARIQKSKPAFLHTPNTGFLGEKISAPATSLADGTCYGALWNVSAAGGPMTSKQMERRAAAPAACSASLSNLPQSPEDNPQTTLSSNTPDTTDQALFVELFVKSKQSTAPNPLWRYASPPHTARAPLPDTLADSPVTGHCQFTGEDLPRDALSVRQLLLFLGRLRLCLRRFATLLGDSTPE